MSSRLEERLNEMSHGGKRPGQGRKALDGVEGTRRVTVSLDDATVEKAEQIGEGTISVGIRRAVAAYKTSGRKKPKTAPTG